MTYQFASNEFIVADILEYMRRAYGRKVDGSIFTTYNVDSWLSTGKIPDAYGGNKILDITHYKELGQLKVITIEHLDRNDIEAIYGSLSDFRLTLNKRRAREPKARKRKVRTELYYQILGKKSQAKNPIMLPNDYRAKGIKENQLIKQK